MVKSWDVAADLPAFDIRPVMPGERRTFLRLIRRFGVPDWERPTVLPGWTVKDIALHILGNDLGRLGPPEVSTANLGESKFLEVARRIERDNEAWLGAARRIPPELVIKFLRVTGRELDRVFAALDLAGTGLAVAWTGTGPSPWWLDIAREYTERWTHHQQIREAVGAKPLTARRWFHPVLAVFIRSLPRAYDSIDATPGSRVAIVVSGRAGGRWVIERTADRWRLVGDMVAPAISEVRLTQDTAWRVLPRLLTVEEALPSIRIIGDRALGLPATRAVAVMTTKV